MPMLAVSCSRKARCEAVNSLQRGQLEHRLDLALEDHREDDDVARQRLEEARADRHRVGRHVGDQHAPLLVARTDR